MSLNRRVWSVALVFSIAGLAAACGGADEGTPDGDGSSGSSGPGTSSGELGASSGNSSGGTSSSGGSNSSSSGSQTASSSSGGPGTCTPGEKSACTIDPCSPGESTCNAEGTGFSACQGTPQVCTGATAWSARYGNTGTTGDSETFYAAAAGADGNRYLVGNFRRDVYFADGNAVSNYTGSTKGWLAKLDPNGAPLWSRAPSVEHSEAGGVGVDAAGNVVMAGAFRTAIDFGNGPVVPPDTVSLHAFVASWFPNGNLRWAKAFVTDAAREQRVLATAVANDGSVAIVGSFAGTVNFGGNLLTATSSTAIYDAFVAKFSATGEHVWSRRLGDENYQQATGVAFDAATGDVFVTASHRGAIDYGGGAIAPTNGGVAFSLARLSGADGGHRWSKRIANGTDLGMLGVRQGLGGSVVVYCDAAVSGVDLGAGVVSGSGLLTSHAGADGAFAWGHVYPGQLALRGAAVDSAGAVTVAGSLTGSTDLGNGPLQAFGLTTDAVFAKFSSTGQLVWARVVGDSNQQPFDQYGRAVTFGVDLRPTVYGDFGGNLNFGDRELVSGGGHGGSDIFLAQLLP